MAAPKKVDWGLVENDWRAGIISSEQLARNYTEMTGVSISRAAVSQHFNNLGIPRNLAARIAGKAEALLAEAMVTGKISKVSNSETLPTEAEIINVNAMSMAEVVLGQRMGAVKLSDIGVILKDDFYVMVTSRPLLDQLGELMIAPDDAGIDKMNEAYRKVVSFPGMVDAYKKLVDAEEKANANARRAFNIKDDSGDEPKRTITEIRLVPLMRTIEHDE